MGLSWSNAVCVMLTMVAQIVITAHRDLWSCMHKHEPWSQTKNRVDLSYFTGFLGHYTHRKYLYVYYLYIVLTDGHQICIEFPMLV